MELSHGTDEASKFAPQDYISNMPDLVITHILNQLPLQDAVKTSVLSRNWRFKWTMLSQLVFDKDFFRYLYQIKEKTSNLRIINRLFLHHGGPITKCVLSLVGNAESERDDEDIHHLILFLSRNGIKDLSFRNSTPYGLVKLPTHLFSCLGLKHLKLENCCIHPPTTFHGFPNLLSLELIFFTFESMKFGEFLTLCPILETLKLSQPCTKVKLDDIAKLANLKTLSLHLCDLEDMTITSSCAFFELLGVIPPKLQELALGFQDCEYADSPPQVDYNTLGPLQLRSVMLEYLKGLDNEVCLIKYLVSCSPFLKKIVIRPHWIFRGNVPANLAMELLNLQRAYPGVDIGVYQY